VAVKREVKVVSLFTGNFYFCHTS